MMTLFSIPKSFRGHTEIIQRNAIRSWTFLKPSPEIILFGDDEGTAEAAKSFGVRHVPKVARNEYGTPLVNDLFEQAQRVATNDLLCYVNADIILMSDFVKAVEQVAQRKRRFLMVGRRLDVDVGEPLDFGLQWEERFRVLVAKEGHLHSSTGIDYFVFPRDLWGKIPPFAIGRTAWDNWLLYRARASRAPVVDATQVVMAVHQNHDYSHNPQGEEGIWSGPEAKRNLELSSRQVYLFTIQDATHVLRSEGIKLALDPWYVSRRLETLPTLYPLLRWPMRLLLWLIALSRPVRARFGLTLPAGGPRNA